jgi:hypothetical protein
LEKAGYESSFKSITVVIQQKNIEVQTIDFQDSIQSLAGEKILLRLNLTQSESESSIANASVYYSWEYGVGYFHYVGEGVYELELDLPDNIRGSHKITLIISKEGSIYKTTEYSFHVSITEKREQPNYLIWIILTVLLSVIITLLTAVSLRSYVYLPRKEKKYQTLLAKTQRYKDIMGIEAFVISHRTSGVAFYVKSYFFLEENKKQLLSGFIHAITTISKEISRKEKQPSTLEDPMVKEKLIELDFKHFYYLICDYNDLRIVFILKEKASERFKTQTKMLLEALHLQFSEDIDNWNGNLDIFDESLPQIMNSY